jgi:RHS repeat-associated protein
MPAAGNVGRVLSLETVWHAFCAARRHGATESGLGVTATLVQTLDYYPYGGLRINTGTGADTKKQYIGQYFDASSNLNYLQNRYYNSSQGQFISEDPAFLAIGNPTQLQQLTQQEQNQLLADPQQLNAYSYGRDNPITRKDPSGLINWELVYQVGENISNAQYLYNLSQYFGENPKQQAQENPQIAFESTLTGAGLVVAGTPAATQLMLTDFALQGFDYVCSHETCRQLGAASNNMTPQQIVQQVISPAASSVSLESSGGTPYSLLTPPQNTNSWSFSQIRLYTTPSGAVVNSNGQVVSGPPSAGSGGGLIVTAVLG